MDIDYWNSINADEEKIPVLIEFITISVVELTRGIKLDIFNLILNNLDKSKICEKSYGIEIKYKHIPDNIIKEICKIIQRGMISRLKNEKKLRPLYTSTA